jgi:heptosyltransferase-1
MKIAIVKLSALGDIIHSAHILQFIKKKQPSIEIDWIVEEAFAPILEHNPHIDEIKKVNLKSIKNDKLAIFKEIKKIRSFGSYDLVIDLQGLIKSAIVSRLLSKNVVGFDKNSTREGLSALFYKTSFDIPYNLNTIDRYRLLASKALNIEISKDEVLEKKPYMFFDEKAKLFFKDSDKKRVIFIIGANWQSRIYPKELLLEVANQLPKSDIYIPHGNESEKKMAKWLVEHSSNITLLPKMNLESLKHHISKASLLIGNDTGPSYIAWANNIPSIILFGSTPTSRIYESDISKTLKSPSKVDPYRLDKGDFSIKEIDPKDIIKLSKELL